MLRAGDWLNGELAGADARAYWAAVRVWLAGGDPYQTVGAYLPYAYAPWTLIVFVPWALLPWSVAWSLWQALSAGAFLASVAWAYRRRPLATALLVAALGVPLAANLDTGNVALLLVMGIWLAWFVGPRLGGLAWALAASMKWLPLLLLPFIPGPARRWGVAFLAVAAVLTLIVAGGYLRGRFFAPRPASGLEPRRSGYTATSRTQSRDSWGWLGKRTLSARERRAPPRGCWRPAACSACRPVWTGMARTTSTQS